MNLITFQRLQFLLSPVNFVLIISNHISRVLFRTYRLNCNQTGKQLLRFVRDII